MTLTMPRWGVENIFESLDTTQKTFNSTTNVFIHVLMYLCEYVSTIEQQFRSVMSENSLELPYLVPILCQNSTEAGYDGRISCSHFILIP